MLDLVLFNMISYVSVMFLGKCPNTLSQPISDVHYEMVLGATSPDDCS